MPKEKKILLREKNYQIEHEKNGENIHFPSFSLNRLIKH